ncbi:MAG TPA: VTT domain-containing protein [Burkholderiaceae bacterium]|nr:VTT domain-containing protein [Burkholderiaceae bacterium]
MKTDHRLLARAATVAGLGALIALAFFYRDALNASALESWVQRAGFWGPVVFCSVYIAATVLCLPGSVLTLAGGALFGAVLGTFYSLTSATIGATLAFLIARYAASDWVARKACGRARQLVSGVEREGWRFVAFVRLVPLLPFNVLNYALGLTRIRLRDFVVASYLFMLPGAVAYTYLGYAGREVIARGEGMVGKGLLALALIGIAAFLPRLVKRLRAARRQDAATDVISSEALRQRLERRDDVAVLDVRPRQDYTGDLGHIEGSINVPFDELPRRVGELDKQRDLPLAVICRTNRVSSQAVQFLRGPASIRPFS